MKKVEKECPAVVLDTETTGFEPNGEDRAFAFSTCDLESERIEVSRLDGACAAEAHDALREVFDGRRAVVMHNAKFDLQFAGKALGDPALWEKAEFHDTYLQSHVLRSDHPSHKLKNLAWELAGIPRDDEDAVRKYVGATGEDYSAVPPEIMRPYQERDARRCALLHLFFWPKIREDRDLLRVYREELDLIGPTIRMEQRGVMIHRGRTEALARNLSARADAALARAEAELGRRVNLGKADVVRHLVYRELGLPVLRRTEKDKKPSVEAEALEELYREHPHPVLRLAVEYSAWRRGATMVASYLDAAGDDDVIHPSINTCRAITARESCTRPNLQNVEKSGGIAKPFAVPARLCFRPRPGYVNFHVDYAGIELCLILQYCREPELLDLIRSGGDSHRRVGEAWYPEWTDDEVVRWGEGIPEAILRGIAAADARTAKALRNSVKGANFAVAYGANWPKVSVALGVPPEIGRRRFQACAARFPRLFAFCREMASEAKASGLVKTSLGRTIYVSPDKPYAAANYLIQCTAAQIIKRAQVRADRLLRKETGDEARLLLPVHDELIIEWPRARLAEAPAVFRKLREALIDFPELDVPLEIEADVAASSWADKKKFVFMEG